MLEAHLRSDRIRTERRCKLAHVSQPYSRTITTQASNIFNLRLTARLYRDKVGISVFIVVYVSFFTASFRDDGTELAELTHILDRRRLNT